MSDLELAAGDLVEVALSADPDPDHVDLGDELAAALAADADAREVWESMTPGTRRALAYTVTSARRVGTREDRAATWSASSKMAPTTRSAGAGSYFLTPTTDWTTLAIRP